MSEVSLTTGQPASNQILVPTDSSGAVTFYASEPTTIVVHVPRLLQRTWRDSRDRLHARNRTSTDLRYPRHEPIGPSGSLTQCNPGTQNGPNMSLGRAARAPLKSRARVRPDRGSSKLSR